MSPRHAQAATKAPTKTQAPPSTPDKLYVVAVAALTAIFCGLALWAALVNTVGPPFSP
jgi:hypothetical protein